MKATDAARAVMRESGVTMTRAAESMGKSQNYVTSALSNGEKRGGGLSVSTLVGIAAACGYALALVRADDVPGGAVVIDAPDGSGD